ncbi:MAG: phosphoribosyltransferase family protein [Gallionella sp.]
MSILQTGLLNLCIFFKRAALRQPCVLCSAMSAEGLCCKACAADLPYLRGNLCCQCALPISSGKICGHCLAHPPIFTRSTAAFAYTFPVNKLIQQFKYGEQLALAHLLAQALLSGIARDDLPDVIIAMPLHRNKLKQRAYNQALLIAQFLARELHIELLRHACERIVDTAPQSTLPFKQRGKNMRNAFVCHVDLSGKKVALVDDVLTSGASLNALARAVKKRGASEIQTWVVARTIRK